MFAFLHEFSGGCKKQILGNDRRSARRLLPWPIFFLSPAEIAFPSVALLQSRGQGHSPTSIGPGSAVVK